MAMVLGLSLSLVFGSQAAAQPISIPERAADLVGTYRISTGFQVMHYELHPGGKLVTYLHHDHPGGGKRWHGTWTYEAYTVVFMTPYHQKGVLKASVEQAVPLAWGRRLMLVSPKALRLGEVTKDFREDLARIVKRGPSDFPDQPHRICYRLVSKDERRAVPRFGKLIAPREYQSFVEGIELPAWFGQTAR